MELVFDCWIEIFEKLSHRDLYSVIRVNRGLCRSAIQILWRAPFDDEPSKGRKLIDTYLTCFTDSEKENLAPAKEARALEATSLRRPTFNYPSFLVSLDYDGLSSVVDDWFTLTFPSSQCQDEVDKIKVEFWNLFLLKSSAMKKLSICLFHDQNPFLIQYQYFERPDVKRKLSNLKHLYFDPDCLNGKSLDMVSLVCVCLDSLSVLCVEDNTTVSRLISAQKHCKSISIFGSDNALPSVCEALRTQSTTLTYLALNDFPFSSQKSRIECPHLERLELTGEIICSYLENLNCPSLKNLVLEPDILSVSLLQLKSFLENTNENLTSLTIFVSDKNENIDPRVFYQIIGKNCPHLLNFSMKSYNDLISELPVFFGYCKRLELLNFSNFGCLVDGVPDLFASFGLLVPPTLSYFRISHNSGLFSQEVLSTFLKDCSGRLNPKFRIITMDRKRSLGLTLREWIEEDRNKN